MKSIHYYLLIFFLPLMCSNAQEQNPDYNAYAPKTFFSEIEFYAGPGISFLRGSAAESNDSNKRKIKVGHSYGIGLMHKIGKNLNLSSKLFFERKGGVSEVTGTYFDESTQTYKKGKSENDYEFNYYSLSISFVYTVDGKNRFGVGSGPYVSHLSKQTLKQTHLFNGSSGINDQTKYYTKFDFGICTLISYKFSLNSRSHLNLQLLNNLGFVNILLNPYEGKVMNTANTSLLIGFISKRPR